jgi:hypothetical protein
LGADSIHKQPGLFREALLRRGAVVARQDLDVSKLLKLTTHAEAPLSLMPLSPLCCTAYCGHLEHPDRSIVDARM